MPSRLVLGLTTDDLHLLRLDLLRIVQFELDVLEDERPHFIAEAIGIQMTLECRRQCLQNPLLSREVLP